MNKLWQQLDRLLRERGSSTGGAGWQELRASHLVWLVVLLGAAYGFFMGWYGVMARPVPEYRQVAACLWKVPALFLLTLFICFPSMYVFSVLLGSRLTFGSTLKVLVVIAAVMVAVLASLGPIVGFFALSTENYSFMKLLNIAFFAVAGIVGIGALVKALGYLLAVAQSEPLSLPTVNAQGEAASPPVIREHFDAVGSWRRVERFFRFWILIVIIVAAQMAWVLRPLVGDPKVPFVWFSPREANFLVDLWNTLSKLFS